MKVGDNVPVTIAGQAVAMATVKEMADGTATLIVPATRVVMAVRTELAYEAPVVQEQTTETIITGVDRADGAGEVAHVPDLTNVGAETTQTVETPVVNDEVATTEVNTVQPEVVTTDAPVTNE